MTDNKVAARAALVTPLLSKDQDEKNAKLTLKIWNIWVFIFESDKNVYMRVTADCTDWGHLNV